MKKGKTQTNSNKPDSNKPEMDLIKTAIYTTEAFHFPPHMAMKMINSGMLGYRTKEDGTPELKDNKPIPITIGKTSYFKYKKEFTDLPEMFVTLRTFALSGYTKLLVGFQDELAYLHKLSIENMMAVDKPLERQTIIDSLISKVIPTESAFADMLKGIVEENPSAYKEKTEDKNEPNHN